MPDPVSRYCPSCGARAKAPAEAFAKPVTCPKCSNVVKFVDHPNAAPKITPIPQQPNEKDPLDYMVKFAVYAAPALLGLGMFSMVFSDHDFSVMISATCLIVSSLLLAKYNHMKLEIKKNKADREAAENIARIKTRDLEGAVSRYQDFKKNFDGLVAARYAEADQLEVRSQKKLDKANERNNVIDRLGKKLLGDSTKWISAKLTPNNFTASSTRLQRVVDFCRKHEYTVKKSYEKELFDDLRDGFEDALRKQHAKEEQQRIKSRIREEQRAEKELDREMQRIASEKDAIEKALASALRKAKDQHSDEVDALREKLREAEERSERAKSMAQLTKAGHVYVISNIGSFGEGIYKVGMTRRLEPLDRVKELGDASVPFPFDVHMMISCDNAPALENAIHKTLNSRRLNKVNTRREFFRVELEEIHRLVIENHGEVEYIAEPEALQYRESLSMSDDDFAFIRGQEEAMSLEDAGGFIED